MHEVSIMMSIMDVALKTASDEGASKIKKISLKIGKKSGVVEDSLEFAFDMVTKNTIAEEASLEIESIPLVGECLSCGNVFESEEFLVCPKCDNFAKALSGQELTIQSIEVE